MISSSEMLFGFLGGLLIGSAALLLLVFNGRVMGVSGILGRLFDHSPSDGKKEAAAFVVGVVGFPLILSFFTDLPETHATSNIGLLVLAGILVGVGTRLGSGCTSGHGVCGMSRFSLRSIVATVTFIVAGVITVAVFG